MDGGGGGCQGQMGEGRKQGQGGAERRLVKYVRQT